MGKKSLVFCDLCKSETTEDNLKELNLVNKYEICKPCFEDLEQKCSSDSAQPFEVKKVNGYTDDELFIAQKQSEVNVIPAEEESAKRPKFAQQAYNSNGQCRHLNKGRVTMGNISSNGQSKRGFFRRCLDCGSAIQESTQEEKSNYINARPVGDIRENKHGNS